MHSFQKAHLILVSLWGGLLLAEIAIELLGRDNTGRRISARLHYWIDLFVEIPLVTGVVATGAILLAPLWPPPRLLAIKIILGLIAIVFNLSCVGLVIRRYRKSGDNAALDRLGHSIRFTVLGLPFGLAAFYLGIAYFGS